MRRSEESAPPAEIGYRPDIDGLRGVAILGVVMNHAGLPGIPGGFTGVDVFFVISGFLITQLLLKEANLTARISIADFYARRIRRLLPALATVIAVTLLLGVLFLPPFGEKQGLARSAVASVVFAANQYFFATTGGYFDQRSELLPLLHLWSLSVEEQFYLVWPLLLIAIVKLSPTRTRVSRIRILILALAAASFAASFWLVRVNPAAAYFVLPSRWWELGVGALLATVPSRSGTAENIEWRRAAGLTGMALIAYGFFCFTATTPFPGASATIPVLGSTLLIFAGMAGRNNLFSHLLSARPLVKIGLLSYSWYLWHWPLLSIVRSRRLMEPNVGMDCAVALLALVLSAGTVRWIENPIRHHRGAKVARKAVLQGGLATLAVLLTLAGAVGAWARYGPQSPYQTMAERELPPLWADCMIKSERKWDGNIFRSKCLEIPSGQVGGKSPLAVVWGDSHADAWAPAVRALAEPAQVEVEEFSFTNCPPLADGSIWTQREEVPNCRTYNARIIGELKRLRALDPKRAIGVVLSARWPGYMGTLPIPRRDVAPNFPRYYSERRGNSSENLETLKARLKQTVSILTPLRMRVLIILSGPEFRVAPVVCAAASGESHCDQPLQDQQVYRNETIEGMKQAVQGSGDVRIVDPLPFFCAEASCRAFRYGHPVAYDESHISLSAAKAFAPSMSGEFQWLLEKP